MRVVTQAQQVLKSHGLGGLIVLTHGLSRDGLQRAEGGLAALRGPQKACGDEFAGGVIAAIIGKLAAGLFQDNVEVRCGPLVEICHGLGHCRRKEKQNARAEIFAPPRRILAQSQPEAATRARLDRSKARLIPEFPIIPRDERLNDFPNGLRRGCFRHDGGDCSTMEDRQGTAIGKRQPSRCNCEVLVQR